MPRKQRYRHSHRPSAPLLSTPKYVGCVVSLPSMASQSIWFVHWWSCCHCSLDRPKHTRHSSCESNPVVWDSPLRYASASWQPKPLRCHPPLTAWECDSKSPPLASRKPRPRQWRPSICVTSHNCGDNADRWPAAENDLQPAYLGSAIRKLLQN
jgi:hypothetical protein